MIPKKIHYIWLGGNKKNKLTEVCINSWKRQLPDYEIIEWNEQRIDLDELCRENIFLAKCVKLKLWAFVSDYLRLWILYNEGGIYLDTDVEVLKKFDGLLDDHVFMGYEANDFIGTAVIGAEQHSKLISKILQFYDKEIWDVDFINNPIIFRYIMEHDSSAFADCKIYPQCYFSPYVPDRQNEKLVESEDTYAIHWYTCSWNMSIRGYVFMNTKHIKNPIMKSVIATKKYLGYLRHNGRKI